MSFSNSTFFWIFLFIFQVYLLSLLSQNLFNTFEEKINISKIKNFQLLLEGYEYYENPIVNCLTSNIFYVDLYYCGHNMYLD